MHTDRALTYDAWALELLAQQKCDHIIRSIDKVLEDKERSLHWVGISPAESPFRAFCMT